jgi:hypothetical protein
MRNTTVFFGLRTEKRLFSSTATRNSGPPNNNMKYYTVDDVLASFPHPILPSVEGEPDYQTIHATRKFLQANSRAIDTHLGGGTLGHDAPTFGYHQAPQGGHQQQRMEQRPNSAQLVTFGKKMCRPTGHAHPSSKL